MPLGRAEWTREPLAGEIDGDRLYGRGTSDMKGGLAAIVVAAERVAELGSGDAQLELVLCAAEETGCEGALALAESEGALGRVGAVLVAEPTSNYPCTAHKGVVWLDAHTSGRTAHGSMPDLGENAVYALARAIGKLEELELPQVEHELLGDPTLSAGHGLRRDEHQLGPGCGHRGHRHPHGAGAGRGRGDRDGRGAARRRGAAGGAGQAPAGRHRGGRALGRRRSTR